MMKKFFFNKAHVAGVLFILTLVTNVLYPVITGITKFPTLEMFYLWSFGIRPIFVCVLAIMGYVLLLQNTSNKPTRIAIFVLIGCWIVSSLNIIFQGLMMNHLISSYISLSVTVFSRILWLASFYSYCLIYRNNVINKKDISWINILILNDIETALDFLANVISTICGYMDVCKDFFGEYVVWTSNISFVIFKYCFLVLVGIAHWHFTHCAAFTGTDEQKTPAQECYTPITKYWVGVLVTVVLGSIIFFLMSYFAEPLLNAIG